MALPVGTALVLLLAVVSLAVGPFDLSLKEVVMALVRGLFPAAAPDASPGAEAAGNADIAMSIVWNIRLARSLLAVLAGAGLALAGAAMQGVFRNPLADPGIIGVSAGATVGAVCAIIPAGRLLPPEFVAHFALWLAPAAALVGAASVTALIYRLSLRHGRVDIGSMLLAGIGVNAAAGAFTGLVSTVLATAEELQTFAFWSLGALNRATWEMLGAGAAFMAPALLIIPFYARALNALTLGEEEAALLGVNVPRAKRALIALAAALTGATVAMCGMLGFVPLIAPHIVRCALGPDHKLLLPAAALTGAALLLAADMVARVVIAPAELPVGILTALLGAPIFLVLLARRLRIE
jgi:iron complex transport system permease protein